VRRVTENQGKNTPGVDNVIWDSPDKKSQAIVDLQTRGYRSKPLRRIYIPKSGDRLRPLSIPVMADRAMQALYLLALDPIAETRADKNSYGFRKGRSTADAIEQIFIALSGKNSARYVLEGDIKACFDTISREWILKNIPINKSILKRWLESGYIYQQVWRETDSGTPQGGIISPVICNLALDGLEKELMKEFAPNGKVKKYNKVNFVRYCDDFIITGRTKEFLRDEVKPVVEKFLKQRGMELSQEKTIITEITDGFDFLGKNIRKYKGKLLIKPSTKNVLSILTRIRQTIRRNLHKPVEELIGKLNPMIKGWANHHRHVVSKESFGKVDNEIFLSLWSWARRRHPKKKPEWIKKKYFKSTGTRNWVFQITLKSEDGKSKTIRLAKAAEVAIKRHVKIKGEANPYDSEWEVYFEERLGLQMLDNLKERKRLLNLWYGQDGMCPICTQKITKESGWNMHHLKRRVDGGKETMDNLVLLHPNCHTQVHNQGLKVSKPRPVKRALQDA
jgi:RNA-directed DNA polymerase